MSPPTRSCGVEGLRWCPGEGECLKPPRRRPGEGGRLRSLFNAGCSYPRLLALVVCCFLPWLSVTPHLDCPLLPSWACPGCFPSFALDLRGSGPCRLCGARRPAVFVSALIRCAVHLACRLSRRAFDVLSAMHPPRPRRAARSTCRCFAFDARSTCCFVPFAAHPPRGRRATRLPRTRCALDAPSVAHLLRRPPRP